MFFFFFNSSEKKKKGKDATISSCSSWKMPFRRWTHTQQIKKISQPQLDVLPPFFSLAQWSTKSTEQMRRRGEGNENNGGHQIRCRPKMFFFFPAWIWRFHCFRQTPQASAIPLEKMNGMKSRKKFFFSLLQQQQKSYCHSSYGCLDTSATLFCF